MSLPAAVEFKCRGSNLVGILHRPEKPSRRAVLVVVGGPQYRVGSHRQFVLLSRALAARGIAVLRFDHRGIGDSDGATTFENLDDDIRAAIDTLLDKVPSASEVVIWGLCDAASAAMMYAHSDPRVTGLVMLNPWVRSDATLARSYLQHYYVRQLLSRDFWRRLFKGELEVRAAARSLAANVKAATRRGRGSGVPHGEEASPEVPFQRRMEEGLRRFGGRTLFILSGEDITATEFRALAAGSRVWRKLLARNSVTQHVLPTANHTFSRQEWRDRVTQLTGDWIASW